MREKKKRYQNFSARLSQKGAGSKIYDSEYLEILKHCSTHDQRDI